jgi:tetratricopeptide (TPR) repeat protein
VARANYAGAVSDYSSALTLAPFAEDVWVTLLNRGSTLQALGRPAEALADLQKAVELSKADRYTLLARGGVYHTLGRYSEAAADYGRVVTTYPADIQPFWVRYALDLYESGQTIEALGISKRVAGARLPYS